MFALTANALVMMGRLAEMRERVASRRRRHRIAAPRRNASRRRGGDLTRDADAKGEPTLEVRAVRAVGAYKTRRRHVVPMNAHVIATHDEHALVPRRRLALGESQVCAVGERRSRRFAAVPVSWREDVPRSAGQPRRSDRRVSPRKRRRRRGRRRAHRTAPTPVRQNPGRPTVLAGLGVRRERGLRGRSRRGLRRRRSAVANRGLPARALAGSPCVCARGGGPIAREGTGTGSRASFRLGREHRFASALARHPARRARRNRT